MYLKQAYAHRCSSDCAITLYCTVQCGTAQCNDVLRYSIVKELRVESEITESAILTCNLPSLQ